MQRIGLPETWDAREADPGFMASLAALSVLALGLELVVDGTVLTVSGTAPALYPLGWQCLVWVALGLAWLLAARALVAWSRRRGVDPLPADPDTRGAGGAPGTALDHRTWLAVLLYFAAAVVLAIVLPVMIGGPWGPAPVDRYLQLRAAYGAAGWLAVLAWAGYLVGRCVVVAGFLAYAHRAALGVATFRGAQRIPWGGVVTGAVMAAAAFLSRGQTAALTTAVACLLLGLIHVRCGESLRITAVFTVLVLAVV